MGKRVDRSMSDRKLSAVELAILRMLRSTGGLPATRIAAPWRDLEQLARAKLVSLDNDQSLVMLTPLGESVVAASPAE